MESQLLEVREVQKTLFASLKDSTEELKKTNASVNTLTNLVGKYTVYNKILWPIVTVLTTTIGILLGTKL